MAGGELKRKKEHLHTWACQKKQMYEWRVNEKGIQEFRVVERLVCKYEGCGKVCKSKAGLMMHKNRMHIGA